MAEVRGKRARSRKLIMHAAKGLFEEKGIRNVTFNDIAERADMCRTTVFNHFATINELMIALAEEEVNDIMDYCDDTKLHGKKLIMAMFDKLIEDTANYPALTSTLTANSIINAQERKTIGRIEQLIIDNVGDMTPKEKEKKVVMLTGSYYGLVNHYFINGNIFDPKNMKRQFGLMAKEILKEE
ncbi:TetR/AcrR family transcriptional regulator [Aminicella lysinilytica]|uniref:TetR family transcriptional regulator n=1 Tax=Aminicella lysinilytica TaxID=433323 RepID=A0A4V3CQV2_9FIRM|nr:TetR/AcrR family transcriptional regulator [Aminicella lysinilytica]NLD11714.1 TetR/AcrR family transcriptional regulator [Clostridiales bacterium]TDP49412.1 TetR family transcriptional regulator [Aminicella lysinilytica]